MFQPASFNSMNHENVFNIVRRAMIGFITVTLAIRGESGYNGMFLIFSILLVVREDHPRRIHSTLHAFLVDQPNWELLEPVPFLAIATTTVSLIISFSTILVKLRLRNGVNTTTTTSHRFKNPLKNMNFIIVILSLTYTLLQIFFFDIKTYPLLLFPRFSLGLAITPMLGLFFLGNPTIQEYALKRIFSLLPFCLEEWHSQRNVIQIQNNSRTSDSQNRPRIGNEQIQMKPIEMKTNFDYKQRNRGKQVMFSQRNMTINEEGNKKRNYTVPENMYIDNME